MCLGSRFYSPIKLQKNAFNSDNYITFVFHWNVTIGLVMKWSRRGSRRWSARRPPPRKKKKGLAWLDWQSLDVTYVILTLCSFDSSFHIAMNILTCLCFPVPDHVKTFHFLLSWMAMLSLMNHEQNERKFKGSLIFSSISPLLEEEGIYLV